MSEEDRELEKLKEKRLAEMQKNISYKQKQDEFLSSQKKKQENMPKPRDTLVNQLGYRGLEVLENAERQFPNETKIVVEKLAELISLGEINEEIDGGKLLLLFRTVGLNIHLETKINVEQDGKFISLSDKLSSKFSSSGESTNQE
ncbi:MAG: double-stranded DNA-binding protein [Thaumarchaeota archaeon]|nr:double-stranded DNA-binding protein [Nitrososphaerota archaeon]